MPHNILVLNPGSTSTKIAHAVDDKVIAAESIAHPPDELNRFSRVTDQLPFRLQLCLRWAETRSVQWNAVAAMGGLLKPVQGGTYRVSEAMLADAREAKRGEHASNLGCLLASEIGAVQKCPAFIVDPVSVDEFEPLARYSGHPSIERRSLSHALNIHAAARRAAEELNVPYEQSSFIIAHLGGGISVAPVRGGRIIDANDAASDGPFSPERTGGLPLQSFIDLCFSGANDKSAMQKLVMGRGGLVAYLGTNSLMDVEARIIAGDAVAREAYQAMVYQIAKEIGAMATVLNGNIDAVVLTGGAVRSAMLVEWLTQRISFLGPVLLYPGEEEMQSLAAGAFRVLAGAEPAATY